MIRVNKQALPYPVVIVIGVLLTVVLLTSYYCLPLLLTSYYCLITSPTTIVPCVVVYLSLSPVLLYISETTWSR